MKAVAWALFATLAFVRAAGAATCTTTYVPCCVETCNSCETNLVQDPAYPKVVTQLPFHFEYSHGDTQTANDACSSDCGVKNCNAGTTRYSQNRLPTLTPGGVCTLTPANRLPASLNCKFRDGACKVNCVRMGTCPNTVCS